jgi:hypothetical protein
VNARKVIAADLGIESSRVVIGRFTGGWLPDDVNRFSARPSQHTEHLRGPSAQRPISYRHPRTGGIVPRRLPREEHSLVLIEPWTGLTETESPVERP